MRRAFTLIELMISVVLLSIIVTFLYQSIAQLQNSNMQLLNNTNKNIKRENLLKVLYNDFINAQSFKLIEKDNDMDGFVLQSSNSFYEMSMPFVRYQVSDGLLRRIESPVVELNFDNNFFRFDTLMDELQSLKVYEKEGHYLIYVKSEGMEDIYLDIVAPALGKNAQGEDNNTSNSSSNENNSSSTQQNSEPKS